MVRGGSSTAASLHGFQTVLDDASFDYSGVPAGRKTADSVGFY
jgi:hypothetical protein